jgi:hypothetical protein
MQSFGMHHWQYAPRAPLRARPRECHAGCTREILTAVFGASAANIAMALQSPQSPRTAAKQARMRPSRTKKVRDVSAFATQRCRTHLRQPLTTPPASASRARRSQQRDEDGDEYESDEDEPSDPSVAQASHNHC